jgi:CheY-like chemotaxis protein
VHSRPRVVIADDHPGVLNAAASMLAQTCDVVATAADGAAALEATLRFVPDVVVLDVAMPRLDGFATAARITAAGSPARIMFLSDHADEDFVLAGVSFGAVAFVAKSTMRRDLLSAVGHALAGRAFIPSAGVLPRWRRPVGLRHHLQLYSTDTFLVDAATRFFATALRSGDSIVAVATETHKLALDVCLRAGGHDPSSLMESGRLSVMDAARALAAVCRNGMPDAAAYAAAVGPLLERSLAASPASPPHVSLLGEIAPMLCAQGAHDAAVELERIAQDFAAGCSLSTLCAYRTADLADDTGLAARICSHHSTIVPGDRQM